MTTTLNLVCSYYLVVVSIFAIGFFAILLALEWNESEYLRVHFHSNMTENNSILNILIAIGIYSGIVILLWKNIISLKKEELHKSFKQSHKLSFYESLEKPSILVN